MCPLCLSTLGWVVVGGVSAGSAGTLLAWSKKKGMKNADDRSE